jgi:hypothetical protein
VAGVEVVGHRAGGWYLLRADGRHYLDVNCHLPLIDISLLVRLDPAEEIEMRALGDTFVDYLAAKINYWPDRYRSRAVEGELAERANAAIARFTGR